MTTHQRPASIERADAALDRHQLARRIAADIPAGSYVNLGIGQPTLVADQLPPGSEIVLHTENGMLGMGPVAATGREDFDLVNAGKIPVTETAGASYFHQADSFAMIRGRHLDFCVLGAFQVSVDGDLANWATGEPDAIPAVGGAMDLAVGARQVFVMMTLFDRSGSSKLVARCDYPLTGLRCVDRVYTDHGVFDICGDGRLGIRATFGIAEDELAARTGLELIAP